MRFNMLTFLGLSLVLVAASGYKKVDIQVALEDSILLSCPCLKRDMARDVSWQTETKNILSYKANITNLSDEYKDRAEIFLTKDSNNCSLLLTNITKYDQGVYKCNYYNPLYNYTEFNLTVVVSYTVCQRVLSVMKGTSERTFQCDVKGRSPGALIHWTLYGERLPTPTISFQNVSNGLYHLSSHLTIELNGTSEVEPLCVVEHTHHTQLYLTNSTCIVDGKESEPILKIGKQTSESVIAISSSVVVVVIIIVLFLLALYLVLYRPRAKRDTEKRIRERRGESEENGLTLIEQSASDHINSDGLIQSTV